MGNGVSEGFSLTGCFKLREEKIEKGENGIRVIVKSSNLPFCLLIPPSTFPRFRHSRRRDDMFAEARGFGVLTDVEAY